MPTIPCARTCTGRGNRAAASNRHGSLQTRSPQEAQRPGETQIGATCHEAQKLNTLADDRSVPRLREGDITLGAIAYHSTLRYTAVVSDQHNMLVALVRRSGETLHQLLDRLESALGPALEDQIILDEINGLG